MSPWDSVHGILQARILEWVAVPSSRGSSQPRDRSQVSRTADDSLPSEPPGPENLHFISFQIMLVLVSGQDLEHSCSLILSFWPFLIGKCIRNVTTSPNAKDEEKGTLLKSVLVRLLWRLWNSECYTLRNPLEAGVCPQIHSLEARWWHRSRTFNHG